jgi:23S rRNA-/tRNA-specific pseudouridylate synthase
VTDKPVKPEKAPLTALLLDEGPHHAVFMKPAGMTVVAGRGVPRPTLLDIAQERFPGARPVHRIDRVTTGLCVVAKTAFGQQALTEAFRRHIIDKRYLALVEGSPSWEKLDIDARLSRVDDPDAKKGPLAWQTIDDNGVRALTRVKVLARGSIGSTPVALVEARPETGRMHQIRCHLAHTGHPIVGDTLYGAKLHFIDDRSVALFALAVSFPLPQGGRAFVTGALPSTWREFMTRAGITLEPVAALVDKFKVNLKPPGPSTSRATSRPPQGRPGQAPPRGGPGRGGPKSPGKPGPRGGRSTSSAGGSARSSRGRPGDRRGR